MTHPLKALIFDVDGTLADTEAAHLAAFNHAFTEVGLDWHWDTPLYTRLLAVSGGQERMLAYWTQRGDLPSEVDGAPVSQFIARLHALKTAAYARAVCDGQVAMRPGVLPLIHAAREAGVLLAIATTTTPGNIASLLEHAMGANWRACFAVIEDAITAPRKKPDPSVYTQTLQRLDLPARFCLAIEDSANGLQAASGAGLSTVITTNAFTAHQDFSGALRVLPDLLGVDLDRLRAWHGLAPAVA